MRWLGLFVLLACVRPAVAHEQEIQRALIERDQQSAAFAAGVRGGAEARRQVEALNEAQLREVQQPALLPEAIVPHARAGQRARLAQERELRFAPPVPRPAPDSASKAPLPLPGGPQPGVDPVAPDRLPY